MNTTTVRVVTKIKVLFDDKLLTGSTSVQEFLIPKDQEDIILKLNNWSRMAIDASKKIIP